MKTLSLLFLSSVAALSLGNITGDIACSAAEDQQESLDATAVAVFTLAQPLPEVPESVMVYRSVTPKVSEENVARLMEAFRLEGRIVDRDRQFVVRNQDKVLEVFKQPGTGYVRFSNNAKLGMEKEARNLPSEDNARAMAEEFLKANGMLPENTFFVGVGYHEFAEWDEEGKTIREGKSAVAAGFGFTIGEMKVIGPGAKAGVVFGEGGEIVGASKIWRDIEPEKEVKIITPQQALTRFRQRWPREAKPEELKLAKIRTDVHIAEVDLTYYAEPGCVPQTHIEPVYVFGGRFETRGKVGEREIKGGDRFEIIIPALPER